MIRSVYVGDVAQDQVDVLLGRFQKWERGGRLHALHFHASRPPLTDEDNYWEVQTGYVVDAGNFVSLGQDRLGFPAASLAMAAIEYTPALRFEREHSPAFRLVPVGVPGTMAGLSVLPDFAIRGGSAT